ncbi:hypothetical protein KP77_34150 [Jeotgalibacillus alimentarius]|uniref:Uncharacterized protein n=1 Tax=Jeotgalibacillus alimentarius TaxID=135826 RepID=A0A0C2QXJ4_9BACL|nr:hypothetical protein [Jeotgalibacillus alimentarius]KIL42785.1 hypothetical protein KP77_34150 [Jeotgalibacillus alimentarius]
MKTNFDFLTKVKGMNVSAIYCDMLHTYKDGNKISVIASPGVLCFMKEHADRDEKFWLIQWEELYSGNDALIVKEQDTPAPLNYKETEFGQQKYIVSSASFTTFRSEIKNVWGYGFTDEGEVWLGDIILELEDSFIYIAASPAIEYKVLDEFPDKRRLYDELLVTTKKE